MLRIERRCRLVAGRLRCEPAAEQRHRHERRLRRHTRQDIRLVVWLLAAIVVLLGVIADCIQ